MFRGTTRSKKPRRCNKKNEKKCKLENMQLIAEKRIEDIAKDNNFFNYASEELIRKTLQKKKGIKVATAKIIVEKLWKRFSESIVFYLEEIDINWEGNFSMDKVREVISPLKDLKILGIDIATMLFRFYKNFEESRKKEDEEEDSDDGIDVDWEAEFYKLKKEKFKTVNYIQVKYQEVEGIKEETNIHVLDEYKDTENDDLGKAKAIKRAIKANDCPVIKALIKLFDLHSTKAIKNKSKEYSLFGFACKVSSIEAALLLLKEGGGIEQRFDNGKDPLYESITNGNKEISEFLIRENAFLKSEELDVLLSAAAAQRGADLFKLLLKSGARANFKNEDGWTLLHEAAFNDNSDVAMLLIGNGVDINATDVNYNTPMHIAAQRNSIKVAKILKDTNKYDKDIRNNDQRNPYKEAELNGSKEVALLLFSDDSDDSDDWDDNQDDWDDNQDDWDDWDDNQDDWADYPDF